MTSDLNVSLIQSSRLSEMEAHLDAGGKFSHDNAVELLRCVRGMAGDGWPDLKAETQTVLTWAHNVMMCCQGLPSDDSLEFPIKVFYLRVLCESVWKLEKAQSDRVLNFFKRNDTGDHPYHPHRNQKPQRRRIEEMDNFQEILTTLKGLLPEVPKGHWIAEYLDYEAFKHQLLRDEDFAHYDFTNPIDEPVRYDIALDIKKKLMGNEFINQCQQIAGRP